VRTLIVSGAEPEESAASVLTLLHQQRASGGWAMGGLLPTDLFTTALALDALSFAGDIPVETLWSRRRAALLLVRAQRLDGGWPLYHRSAGKIRKLLSQLHSAAMDRSRGDVTALVVQALAYSSVSEPAIESAIEIGVHYLLRTQDADGLWRGDSRFSDVFTTCRTVEALWGAAPEKSRHAILLAVRAMLRRQREDGSWGSTHDTAWVLRALAGIPGVPMEVLKRGRVALESALDSDELAWFADGSPLPSSLGDFTAGASDLTTLWALEALAPVTGAARTRRVTARKPRSISDRKS